MEWCSCMEKSSVREERGSKVCILHALHIYPLLVAMSMTIPAVMWHYGAELGTDMQYT